MAPPGSRLDLQYRIRRWHPFRPAIEQSLALLDHADEETISRYQDRRLRQLVRLAEARSPFYRAWFREAGLDPRSVRTAADLARLPLLERSDLVTGAERFQVYPSRLLWEARSSGTTGAPITCYRTPGSSVFELSALERQWSWFGLGRSTRRVVLRGGLSADQTTRLLPGARQLLVSSFALTTQSLPAIIDAIRGFDPDAIEGWPSAIALLASFLHDQGLTLPVRAVITSSEVTTDAQADLMRAVFRGPVIDHYGQTERVALAGGCEAGGYHVFPDYGIVELLPVPGVRDRWEIVGTPLHNWGFPLFRYRTGDHVGPAGPGPCPCGRAYPLLGRVDGRHEEPFTSADGRSLPMPAIVTDNLDNVHQAQVAQLAPGRFEVRVVPAARLDLQAATAQVQANVDRYFGPGQAVTVRVVDTIPLTGQGKARNSVIDPDDVVPTSAP
ncbi:phenylacetate--CoA ligase family protein [Trebonia kvetii]|uniref:Phenylacetate--CoA ligase family protein n=1 Tax=Trebonia kvetii TaxID=2480626 RepID=A0A6P2BZA8_9ACTN|nr:phenylacetate--CoA ligase family protein [Trebonia kvetii]TVZ04479.1 phenylacetate--CoA ligase family protein [Trebonia kvetii]